MLLEIFFSAPHASVRKYIQSAVKANFVVPFLEEYEYLLNGKLSEDVYRIKDIQEGALRFVECYKMSKLVGIIPFESTLSTVKFVNFGLYPKIEDVCALKDLKFDSNGFYPLVSELKTFTLISLRESIKKSLWISGFIKYTFKNDVLMGIILSLYKIKRHISWVI